MALRQPIIGRHAELAALDDFLERGDDSRAMVIEGEAGIGKSVLFEAAAASAAARGARVLSSRPIASETKLALAGLSDLFAEVGEETLECLPPPQRRALEVALLRCGSDNDPRDARVLSAAFLSALRALAVQDPVVVAVDDLQWLDTASQGVLEFGLRRLREEPVRLLAAVRVGADKSPRAPVVSSLPSADVRRVRLGPLSLSAVHHVLKEHLGHTFPRRVLVQIERTSGGNPFFALELGRAFLEEGSGSEMPALPASLLDLVRGRLRRLPASCRAELLAVAAASHRDVELFDRHALAPAEDARVVEITLGGRVTFDHPLVAAAVYGGAPATRRRAVHARLAERVRNSEERARHLALSVVGPDEAVARALEAAATEAAARGAPATGVELLELALDRTPTGAEGRDRRSVELAQQLNLAGDLRRSGELLEQLVGTVTSPDLRARALLLLSDVAYWTTGASAACSWAEQAIEAADDPLLRARAHAVLGISSIHDVRRSVAEADQALRLLREREDDDPETVSLALCTRARGNLFMGRGYDPGAVERAVALEADSPPVDGQNRASFKQGQLLKYVDDLDGSRRLLEASLRAAVDEEDHGSLPNILVNLTMTECWAGNWDAASAHADRAMEEGEQLGVFLEGPLAYKAYVAAHRGESETASAVLDGGEPTEPVVTALLWRSLGLAQLACGDHNLACANFARALELLEQIGFAEPAIWRVHGDAVEAAVAIGELRRAEDWLHPFELHAARVPIPWSRAVSARARGLVYAASGDLEAADSALGASLGAHLGSPVPFELARTLLVKGQLYRRLNRRLLAREALTESLEIFGRLGAPPWVARASDELGRLGLRRRGGDELTPTEAQIAALAAEGLTNRQIAERAFVSAKTVEANLARVYRKLGIRSRAELGRRMAEREATTTG